MSSEITAPVSGSEPISVRDAATLIGSATGENPPKRAENTDETPVTNGHEAPEQVEPGPDESGSQEPDAGPDEVPGETAEADPAEPSIERPRSWAKEHDEAFKALPRHLQEVVAESERAREADFLRRTNETAERARANETERQAAEQVRQQYEQALPNLLQAIESAYARDFGDIQTIEDVERLSQEDPIRFNRWQVANQRTEMVRQETAQANERQQQEYFQQFQSFCTEQDKAFLEKAPEFADPALASQKQAEARAMLTDLGFTNDEMASLWGGQPISIRDHRLQLLVRDAMRYRAASAKAKSPAKATVPPVQRPGVAPQKGEARTSQLQDLKTRLDRTGDIRDAARLLSAQRRSA